MIRRDFLFILGGAAGWPIAGLPAARAEPANKLRRVGFLGNSTPVLEANLVAPFRDELRALGYQEGRSIEIVYRWAEGRYATFPKLVAELIVEGVEVIVTAGTPATLAVKRATRTVPLVMVAVGDPLGNDIVPSLARPGGNIIGLSSMAPDLESKRLQLLRDIVPKVSRIGFFRNPGNLFHVTSMKNAEPAAKRLGIELQVMDVRTAEDIDAAFERELKEQPATLLFLADRVFLHNRQKLMDFAAKNHLPTMVPYRELVEVGGLVSYGPSYEHMHRRAAYYVDKILKGTKPGDLPVEQPTRFQLVVNLRAAKALGITVPRSVLIRADEVLD